jgi:1,2-diacylglycerol 3-alpha-glucosyltransferase
MIIGQYIDTYLPAVDGVIMTVHNYARCLNTGGNICYVAAAAAPRGYEDKENYPIIRYRSVPISRRPPYRYGLPLLDMRFVASEIDLAPNLVHAHSPFPAGSEALRIARLKHIPLVASFHSKYYDDILEATGSKLLAEQAVQSIVRFYHRADFVWTVNTATARTLSAYGYRKTPEIMPNGTDFVLPPDQEAARQAVSLKFGLSPDEPVILFVGQQVNQKNLPMLLEAAALYKQQGGRFRLLMVGEGVARTELEQQAHDRGLDGQVIFTGVIRDRAVLSAIYLRADLFAFPSIYDNAPLVIREAAAAGCPSVLIAGSNAAEDLQDEVNAYLCRNEAGSLCQAFQRAFLDADRRRAIGRQAARYLGRPWSEIIQTVAGRYSEIIREYTGRKKSARKYFTNRGH